MQKQEGGLFERIQAFFAKFFNKSKGPLPKIGKHLGLSPQDLNWDKKTALKWQQIYRTYGNSTEKTIDANTLILFTEIETYAKKEPKYLSYFFQEIWDNRAHGTEAIADLCVKLGIQFFKVNRPYFIDHPDLIFTDIENPNEKIHRMGIACIHTMQKEHSKWLISQFGRLNQFLWAQRSLLEKLDILTNPHHYPSSKTKKSPKTHVKTPKHAKVSNSKAKSSVSKPIQLDIYYYLWTDILENNPDLLIDQWDELIGWFQFYEPLAQKLAQRAIRPSITRSPPKMSEYGVELVFECLDSLFERKSENEETRLIHYQNSFKLIQKILSYIQNQKIADTSLLQERMLSYFPIFLQHYPEIFDSVEQIHEWIQSNINAQLPVMVYEEIASQIIRNSRLHLMELYFEQFLTHLSYSSELFMQKTVGLLYYLHQTHDFFSTPPRFQLLIFTLDQENTFLREKMLNLLAWVLKDHPFLYEYLIPLISTNLTHPESALYETTLFLLQQMIVIIRNYKAEPDIFDYFLKIFTHLISLQNSTTLACEVDKILGKFLLALDDAQNGIISPYREWVEKKIAHYESNFSMKEIYSKIRSRIIRSEMTLHSL